MADELYDSKVVHYFHETSLNRETISSLHRPEYSPTSHYKSYPEAIKIPLPRTSWKLKEARIIPLLQRRRSARQFAPGSIKLTDLAFILWGSQGVTAQAGPHYFRTAPSAGALYPIETYVIVQNIDDVEPGIYHFDVRSFQLELLSEGDYSEQVSSAFLDQNFMKYAAFNIIWTAVLRRTMTKYGDRGGRYLLLDSAHICQNMMISAEAVGCAGCPVAAFYDDETGVLLDIDGTEELPLYGASIGKKK